MSSDDISPITVYSSWRSLLAGIFTPAILITVACLGMVLAGRVAVLAVIVLVIGVGLGAVSLIDMPRRCVFDADGVHRRCILRSQHLPWSSITALGRAPGPVLSGGRAASGRRIGRSLGGLSANVAGSKYLLIDVPESQDEFDEIARAMRSWCPAVALRAPRPLDGTPPTWLYHKRDVNKS